MLYVGKIEEGFVLDHIQAGKSLSIYKHLGLDKLDCTVAIIKNAKSGKMGKKDILKVECDIDTLNLDILGFIDHNITVNVIKNSEIVQKRQLTLPREIKNVLKYSSADLQNCYRMKKCRYQRAIFSGICILFFT